MIYEKIESRIFENHAEYNRYLTIEGMQVSNGATKPSIYITELKIKNILKELNNDDIREIFKNKKITDYNCDIHRDKLKEKIPTLQDWQLLSALSILMEFGRYECMAYVKNCKKTDIEEK